MHYYKFNIKDWNLSTSHLNVVEEAIYLRLVNYYYDTEKPIPEETEMVYRRLRIGTEVNVANRILNEFFFLSEKGWIHNRCDKEIKEYKKKAKTNKENGKKGGRPRKQAACNESQEKPSRFPNGKQDESEQNPNHKPLTNNHKPLTNNHKPLTNNHKPLTNSKDIGSPKAPAFNFKKSLLELGADEKSLSDWLAARKKKKAANTETALKKFLAEVDKSGLTLNQVLELCAANSWSGFKASWDYEGKHSNGFSPLTNKNIQNTMGWIDNE